jgi:hypothetical protein
MDKITRLNIEYLNKHNYNLTLTTESANDINIYTLWYHDKKIAILIDEELGAFVSGLVAMHHIISMKGL